MFNTVSMTGTGMAVYILSFVLSYMGVDVSQDQAAEAVANFIGVVGFVLMVVGQIRRSDLVAGLWRK